MKPVSTKLLYHTIIQEDLGIGGHVYALLAIARIHCTKKPMMLDEMSDLVYPTVDKARKEGKASSWVVR